MPRITVRVSANVPLAVTLDETGTVVRARLTAATQDDLLGIVNARHSREVWQATYEKASRSRLYEGHVRVVSRDDVIRYYTYVRSTKHHHLLQALQSQTPPSGKPPTWAFSRRSGAEVSNHHLRILNDDLQALNRKYPYAPKAKGAKT